LPHCICFYIEPNFGHHANAVTKEDTVTAQYNQTVYSYWFTPVIRQYSSALKIAIQTFKINE
jgi:alkane 1-monooxygenase